MNFFALLVFATVASTAVTNEGNTVQIESDNAIHERQLNTSEWTGNVVLTENGYVLTSETLRAIYNDENQIIKLIATGKPVKATGPNDDSVVQIEGETIVYDAETQVAKATGAAQYSDGTTHLQAESILYRFVQKQLESRGRNRTKVESRTGP